MLSFFRRRSQGISEQTPQQKYNELRAFLSPKIASALAKSPELRKGALPGVTNHPDISTFKTETIKLQCIFGVPQTKPVLLPEVKNVEAYEQCLQLVGAFQDHLRSYSSAEKTTSKALSEFLSQKFPEEQNLLKAMPDYLSQQHFADFKKLLAKPNRKPIQFEELFFEKLTEEFLQNPESKQRVKEVFLSARIQEQLHEVTQRLIGLRSESANTERFDTCKQQLLEIMKLCTGLGDFSLENLNHIQQSLLVLQKNLMLSQLIDRIKLRAGIDKSKMLEHYQVDWGTAYVGRELYRLDLVYLDMIKWVQAWNQHCIQNGKPHFVNLSDFPLVNQDAFSAYFSGCKFYCEGDDSFIWWQQHQLPSIVRHLSMAKPGPETLLKEQIVKPITEANLVRIYFNRQVVLFDDTNRIHEKNAMIFAFISKLMSSAELAKNVDTLCALLVSLSVFKLDYIKPEFQDLFLRALQYTLHFVVLNRENESELRDSLYQFLGHFVREVKQGEDGEFVGKYNRILLESMQRVIASDQKRQLSNHDVTRSADTLRLLSFCLVPTKGGIIRQIQNAIVAFWQWLIRAEPANTNPITPEQKASYCRLFASPVGCKQQALIKSDMSKLTQSCS